MQSFQEQRLRRSSAGVSDDATHELDSSSKRANDILYAHSTRRNRVYRERFVRNKTASTNWAFPFLRLWLPLDKKAVAFPKVSLQSREKQPYRVLIFGIKLMLAASPRPCAASLRIRLLD